VTVIAELCRKLGAAVTSTLSADCIPDGATTSSAVTVVFDLVQAVSLSSSLLIQRFVLPPSARYPLNEVSDIDETYPSLLSKATS
jgi:hypothetical protein